MRSRKKYGLGRLSSTSVSNKSLYYGLVTSNNGHYREHTIVSTMMLCQADAHEPAAFTTGLRVSQHGGLCALHPIHPRCIMTYCHVVKNYVSICLDSNWHNKSLWNQICLKKRKFLIWIDHICLCKLGCNSFTSLGRLSTTINISQAFLGNTIGVLEAKAPLTIMNEKVEIIAFFATRTTLLKQVKCGLEKMQSVTHIERCVTMPTYGCVYRELLCVRILSSVIHIDDLSVCVRPREKRHEFAYMLPDCY
jgi:hypothetical protein